MTTFNQPKRWTHELGNNADVQELPDDTGATTGLASLQRLFQMITQTPIEAGGIAPDRVDFNSLFKLLGDNVYFSQQGGVWLYNAQVDYAVGRIVLHTDGNFYQSLKANGPSSTVKAPGSDESTWTKIINKDTLDSRLTTYDNQLLNDKTKCFGNDYYDDSDITSLIYAGNGAGTIRNEIANGNFARVHPGQTIRGKATGTTYIVVGCNVYLNRGDPLLTRNHLGLIPLQLVGNSGSLLWSGQIWAGDATKNTKQGYAPWNADNENVGKNVTCAYKDSYMAKTVIPKVINNWLKKDFEEQGISVLTFRNLFSTGFDANLPCMSYPAWKGACLYAEWADCKAVLMSEPEVYGGYRWASSPYDSIMQHLQLPLFRHRSIHEIFGADIWLKDVASVSDGCYVSWTGADGHSNTSGMCRVCPVFLIA